MTECDGRAVETDREWAAAELRMFIGGYCAERLLLGDNNPNWVNGENADYGMRDYCAVQHLEIPNDIVLLHELGRNEKFVPYHLWREKLRQFDWVQYDMVIEEAERRVMDALAAHRPQLLELGRRLLSEGYLRGRDIYAIMERPWPGVDRTGAWVDF
ncbi:hypothetical protein H6770_01020 [Candidatus Peribacteria bacterium]|nr:hypothetical protein [Candidatus Peribacteria bacterium]